MPGTGIYFAVFFLFVHSYKVLRWFCRYGFAPDTETEEFAAEKKAVEEATAAAEKTAAEEAKHSETILGIAETADLLTRTKSWEEKAHEMAERARERAESTEMLSPRAVLSPRVKKAHQAVNLEKQRTKVFAYPSAGPPRV